MAHRDLGPSAETLILTRDIDKICEHAEHCNCAAGVAEIIRRWHDDDHDGTFEFCDSQPCRAVRQTITPVVTP